MTSSSSYGICLPLPSDGQLQLLFDLLELSGNIQGLLDFLVFFITPREEMKKAHESNGTHLKTDCPSKLILIASCIRKYYSCVVHSVITSGRGITIFRG